MFQLRVVENQSLLWSHIRTDFWDMAIDGRMWQTPLWLEGLSKKRKSAKGNSPLNPNHHVFMSFHKCINYARALLNPNHLSYSFLMYKIQANTWISNENITLFQTSQDVFAKSCRKTDTDSSDEIINSSAEVINAAQKDIQCNQWLSLEQLTPSLQSGLHAPSLC